MADSPGRLLSSICLGGESDSPPKYGGCVNVFLHLFDWNRRLCKRGLMNKKLLPAERPQRQQSGRKKKQKMNEDRLPMAKLLLIADENRRFTSAAAAPAAGQIGEQQEPAPKPTQRTPGAIGRLMGLEHMPQGGSPQAIESQCVSPASAAATTEMRSLQELLHLEQEPKMLQEFLSGKQEQQQQNPSQHDALLNLLIQEVMHAKDTHQQQQQQPRRPRQAQRSSSKGNFLSRQIFGSSGAGECAPATSRCPAVATAGCAGFSKKKPGLFLEAATTMLEPRNHPVASPQVSGATTTSAGSKQPEEEEDCDPFARRARSPTKRRVMSAPCSPVANRNLGAGSSCTSIRSLMELFLDDLEAELQHESSSSSSSSMYRHAMSEPCSPIRQAGFGIRASAEHNAMQEAREREAAERPVPVDDLGDHDYISFRDFLTGAKSLKPAAACSTVTSSSSSPASNEQSSSTEALQQAEADAPERAAHDCCQAPEIGSGSGHDITRYMSRVVHNPLFEDTSSDNASSAAGSFFSSEFEGDEDQGLEEILKSILCQTKERGLIDTSRLTWFPDASSSSLAAAHNNYLYNKDGNEADESPRSKGMLDQVDDSLEATSESNCGEDCGQPSPVSVLDSPFDECPRKGTRAAAAAVAASSIHRKQLNFDEQVDPTSTSTGGSSSPFLARLQCFDPETLEEAAEYTSMVLEKSGLVHHAEVLLLLLPESSSSTNDGGGIISNSVFERLEDRMRVQQLIQHLEHCGSSSDRSSKNLESLRAHYQSYHECRSRRRMVFDFINETVSSIMAPLGDSAWPRVPSVPKSGSQLVDEVNTTVSQWRRRAFESTQELVESDMNRSCKAWREFSREVSEIGLCCERDILATMIEELANDLLACRQD